MGQNTQDKESIHSQIIASLNVSDLDPLQRFAMATVLQRAAAEVASQFAADAINFALVDSNGCQPEASAGKDFYHKGQCFRVTFKNEFNYNQGDELGKEWASADKERTKLRESAKALTEYISGLQKRILDLHPRMQPTETKVSISYYDK